MQTTPLAIYNPSISPHVTDITDLSSRLIMNVIVTSVLLSKAKNLAKSDKVNSVVLTISHPVNLIRGLVIEVCGMKLCNDLLIPVILETCNTSGVLT